MWGQLCGELWGRWAVMLAKLRPFTTVLLAVVIYSFVVNYFFGHRSYWRSMENMKSVVGAFVEKILALCAWETSTEVQRVQISFSSSQLLQQDVALEICGYLSAYELLQMSQSSKTLHDLCTGDFLWESLFDSQKRRLQRRSRCPTIPFSPHDFPVCGLKGYFIAWVFNLDDLVVTYNDVCVLVNGDLYDLTEFKDNHPGGADIIADCRGRDATFEFTLANHSWIALEKAKLYLVVRHGDLFGRKGLPAAVRYLKGRSGCL